MITNLGQYEREDFVFCGDSATPDSLYQNTIECGDSDDVLLATELVDGGKASSYWFYY